MNFFGTAKPQQTPGDLAKQWTRELAKVGRGIDRDMMNLKRAEQKSMLECKKLAKAGQLKATKILAKEVVNTRKAIERMHMAKAQINSVSMELKTTASMIKVQGCMAKSTDIMAKMNKLVNIPEISQVMASLGREMQKAGLVEEIMGEAMDSMDADGVESAADAEVDKIMQELAAGVLAPAGHAPVGLKRTAKPAAEAEEEEAPVADDSELRAMQDRLQALQSS